MENPSTLVHGTVPTGVHEPVPSRGIEVDRGTVLAAVGLLGVALGALGPWATFSVFSLAGYRTEDGKAILAVAGFAVAALLLGRMNLVSRTATILAMILAGYGAAHDGVEIAVGASFARVQGSQLAFADWGTYAIVVGAAFVIVGLGLRFNFWVRVVLIVLVLAAATVGFYWIEHPPTWAQHGGPVLH